MKDFVRITLLTDRPDEMSKHFFHRHGFHESKMVPMRWLTATPPVATEPAAG